MVKIVADTTSAYRVKMLKTLGIPLIPQIVCFGEDSLRDDTELDTTLSGKTQGLAELPRLPRRPGFLPPAFPSRHSRMGKMW